jgi:hypothetical protein
MYLAQFRNRLLVMIRWGIQNSTFGRGSRLISPSTQSEPPE